MMEKDYFSLAKNYIIIQVNDKRLKKEQNSYILHKDDKKIIKEHNSINRHKIRNYDILSWSQDLLEEYYVASSQFKDKPHLLVRESENAISYQIIELIYLLKSNELNLPLKYKKESVIPHTYKNPSKIKFRKKVKDIPFFGSIDYDDIPLLFVPSEFIVEGSVFESRRKGRYQLEVLEEIGLLKRENDSYIPTKLLEVLFKAWNSWLALAARKANSKLPDKFKQELPKVLHNLKDVNLLTYLQNKFVYKQTLIPSVGLGSHVSYTPTKIAFEAVLQKEKVSWFDIDFILERVAQKVGEDNRFEPMLITAEGGYGKTSLTKGLFLKSMNDYLDGKLEYIPFMILLSDFGSTSLRFSEWLEEKIDNLKLFGDDSKKTFRALQKKGNFLFLVDGIDALPADQRSNLNQWLIEVLEDENRFFLTSRPYVLPTLNTSCERYTILPLTIESIKDFIRNRQKNKKLLDKIISKINSIYNPLLYIPFYLDLISSLELTDFPDDEVDLLNKWLVNLRKRHTYLCDKIDKVEKLAFKYCFLKNTSFTEDDIKSLTKDNDLFQKMERAGWIKPVESFYHESYIFTHDRLREYLAGRFIWKNWSNESVSIYDDDSLLRFVESDKIYEFAFFYGSKLTNQSNQINNRLTDLCGEISFLDKKINFGNLKAPFLATFIASCLEVDENELDWLIIIKDLSLKIWLKFFAGVNTKHKLYQQLRHLYPILCKVMLFIEYDYSELDYTDLKLECPNFWELEKMLHQARDLPPLYYEKFILELAEYAYMENVSHAFIRSYGNMQFNPKLKWLY
ncbi:MAG: NACHT domain-containing protein [Candidatus Heimdallarchaeota archaeon]